MNRTLSLTTFSRGRTSILCSSPSSSAQNIGTIQAIRSSKLPLRKFTGVASTASNNPFGQDISPYFVYNSHSSISRSSFPSPVDRMSLPIVARSQPSRRFSTRSSDETSETETTGADGGTVKDEENVTTNEYEPFLVYQAPMGSLITRLKRVSITSCLISVIGLPMMVFLKTGTWPNVKQLGLGSVAFVSAGGSTLALHFVFGPYVMDLYELVGKGKDTSSADEVDREGLGGRSNPSESELDPIMMKATIRSIFGVAKDIIFDPSTDLSPYAGSRPFANFIVTNEEYASKGVVLYCHPEMLSERLRKTLLQGNTTKAPKKPESPKRPAKDDDDDFL